MASLSTSTRFFLISLFARTTTMWMELAQRQKHTQSVSEWRWIWSSECLFAHTHTRQHNTTHVHGMENIVADPTIHCLHSACVAWWQTKSKRAVIPGTHSPILEYFVEEKFPCNRLNMQIYCLIRQANFMPFFLSFILHSSCITFFVVHVCRCAFLRLIHVYGSMVVVAHTHNSVRLARFNVFTHRQRTMTACVSTCCEHSISGQNDEQSGQPSRWKEQASLLLLRSPVPWQQRVQRAYVPMAECDDAIAPCSPPPPSPVCRNVDKNTRLRWKKFTSIFIWFILLRRCCCGYCCCWERRMWSGQNCYIIIQY